MLERSPQAPDAPLLAGAGEPALDARDLRAVLFLEALEEEDPEGLVVGPSERRRAAERAARGGAGALAQLVERGRSLAELAAERGLWRESRSGGGGWLALLFVLVSACAGFALSGLGSGRELNVLANTLAGIVVWNLAAYLLFLAMPRIARALGAPCPVTAGLARALAWTRKPARHLLSGEAGRVARVRARLAASWTRAAWPLYFARARLVLHLAALAFAAGALASSYRSGLVLEYRASWESTFLDAEWARSILNLFFLPARALGWPAFSALELEAIRAPASGDAARWIHLWALSIAGWVGLPRTAFALGAVVSARRLAGALPFELAAHPTLLRLSRGARGEGREVVLLPYALTLDAERRERLVSFAAEVYGARATITFGPELRYGAEAELVPGGPGDERSLVLVFPLAQTPESEVHGRLVEELSARARARAPERERVPRLLVLVDASAYRERLGQDARAAERLAERTRAWEAVLREAGARALVLDLAGPAREELALRAAEVLRP